MVLDARAHVERSKVRAGRRPMPTAQLVSLRAPDGIFPSGGPSPASPPQAKKCLATSATASRNAAPLDLPETDVVPSGRTAVWGRRGMVGHRGSVLERATVLRIRGDAGRAEYVYRLPCRCQLRARGAAPSHTLSPAAVAVCSAARCHSRSSGTKALWAHRFFPSPAAPPCHASSVRSTSGFCGDLKPGYAGAITTLVDWPFQRALACLSVSVRMTRDFLGHLPVPPPSGSPARRVCVVLFLWRPFQRIGDRRCGGNLNRPAALYRDRDRCVAHEGAFFRRPRSPGHVVQTERQSRSMSTDCRAASRSPRQWKPLSCAIFRAVKF